MISVLIVDDEANIRDSLQDILEDEGYKVFSAENGAKAISICKKEKIDIALVDLWLPNVQGIEVIQRIKEIDFAVEVIVITGHGNVNSAISAMQAGAFDFLEKPLSIDKVILTIKKALEHKFLLSDFNIIQKNFFTWYKIPTLSSYSEINKIAENFFNSNDNLLIYGEKGTGKKSFIFYLYSLSLRNNISAVLLTHEPEIYNYKEKYIFVLNMKNIDYNYFSEFNKKYNNRLIIVYDKEILGKSEESIYRDIFKIVRFPSLKENEEIFFYFFNHFLIYYSNILNQPLKEIEKSDLKKIFNMEWKYNIFQLKNIIEFLYINYNSLIIKEETVRKILKVFT